MFTAYQAHVAQFYITCMQPCHCSGVLTGQRVNTSDVRCASDARTSGSGTAGIRNSYLWDNSQGLMLCIGVCRAAGLPKGTDAGFSSCSASTLALQSTVRAEAVLTPSGGHLTSRCATPPTMERFGTVSMLHRPGTDQQWCCNPCVPREYMRSCKHALSVCAAAW